jgi:hypothetical protein
VSPLINPERIVDFLVITANCVMCGEIADCDIDQVCDYCKDTPEYADFFPKQHGPHCDDEECDGECLDGECYCGQ